MLQFFLEASFHTSRYIVGLSWKRMLKQSCRIFGLIGLCIWKIWKTKQNKKEKKKKKEKTKASWLNIKILQPYLQSPTIPFTNHSVKSVLIRSFSVWRDTPYLFVFNQISGKYGAENLRMWTLFTQIVLPNFSRFYYSNWKCFIIEASAKQWSIVWYKWYKLPVSSEIYHSFLQ